MDAGSCNFSGHGKMGAGTVLRLCLHLVSGQFLDSSPSFMRLQYPSSPKSSSHQLVLGSLPDPADVIHVL